VRLSTDNTQATSASNGSEGTTLSWFRPALRGQALLCPVIAARPCEHGDGGRINGQLAVVEAR
jgi:hypothetical protein